MCPANRESMRKNLVGVAVLGGGLLIIDEVNKLPLSTFQRPEEPTPTGR
jgi:hypothetical protein